MIEKTVLNTGIITLVVLAYFIILLVKNIRYSKKIQNSELEEKACGLNGVRSFTLWGFIMLQLMTLISLLGISVTTSYYGEGLTLYITVVRYIILATVLVQLIVDIFYRIMAQKARNLTDDEKNQFQRVNRFSIIKGIIFFVIVVMLNIILQVKA